MARPMRGVLQILIPSLVVVVASHIAFEVFPAHWGGPNIGGGLVLLVAYIGVATGLVRLGKVRLHRQQASR